jgi:hypothetical protein
MREYTWYICLYIVLLHFQKLLPEVKKDPFRGIFGREVSYAALTGISCSLTSDWHRLVITPDLFIVRALETLETLETYPNIYISI